MQSQAVGVANAKDPSSFVNCQRTNSSRVGRKESGPT